MRATRFPERQTVSDRIAGFMAHLRVNGIRAGLSETETTLTALALIDGCAETEVRSALKAICVHSVDAAGRFDELFNAYWLTDGRERLHQQPSSNAGRSSPRQTSNIRDMLESRQGRGTQDAPDLDDDTDYDANGIGRLIASRAERLKRTDLRMLTTPQELAEAQAMARTIAQSFRDHRSRRRKAARRGASLDLRRIARHLAARGGDPVQLLRKRRPDRPVNIAAICDVSGSMDVYSRVFLAFLQGLVAADRRTNAFLLHTRLVEISHALRDRDSLRAVERLSLMANGFGGGTRIGANLKQFNDQYARNIVNGRTVVLILSDGYDTGPADLIGHELARLKRRGCRIVWLNPLKGWANYEPVARGMAGALPHLDLFAPANTLESLAALEAQFRRM